MLYVLQGFTKQMEIFKVDWGLAMWGENVEMGTLVNGVWGQAFDIYTQEKIPVLFILSSGLNNFSYFL